MRVLFGIILGVALTIGAAFVSDTWSTSSVATTATGTTVEHRQMVNWDVVNDNFRVAQERVRETWINLSRKVTS
jgi:hypothetical protein